MSPMTMPAFQEYLELHSYFGRDGLPRLDLAAFKRFDVEIAALVAKAPALDAEDVKRYVALQTLLLRERPKVKTLLSRR